MKKFRFHGDNIVECERISDLIIRKLEDPQIKRGFISLACPAVFITAKYKGDEIKWQFEFFPGFNKSRNDRWKCNVLDKLKNKGSFLDETPDVVLTEVVDGNEEIIVAIEFCSALQAGNQAWQRSGRAYSVGRANCPYIYLMDFVKYELDTTTRERKALRFPNPAVVYSYIAHSLHSENFITQAYAKAEEFQPDYDAKIKDCPLSVFGVGEVADYIILKFLHKDTKNVEKELLEKNSQMVEFLATDKARSFTSKDWDTIYNTSVNVVDYSKKKKLSFSKKIAKKSTSGQVIEFRDVCTKYSVGVGSPDLPFGLIPKENMKAFANEVIELYSISDVNLINKLKAEKDTVVCMLKGFKPGGDDNRPDRGALPLVAMLLDEDISIITFVFGPMIKAAAKKLREDVMSAYKGNGLWKTIIGLSNFVFIDSPFVGGDEEDVGVELIFDNEENKNKILNTFTQTEIDSVDPEPNRFQENDVDSIIHYIFKHIAFKNSFEGMCNPPGGDWSGLSVVSNGDENRWLSLPRVSDNGKRPDHLIQLFELSDKPVLLVIESKEKSTDLESKVGEGLKNYIDYLFKFTPSVIRGRDGVWKIGNSKCSIVDYNIVSVGAFLKSSNCDIDALRQRSRCDMLFVFEPDVKNGRWILEIACDNDKEYIKEYLANLLKEDNVLPAVIK